MAKITKVPNGPLIKKKGPYAGSTLKTGGKIKKAQDGFNKIKPGTKQPTPKYNVPESRFVITNDTAKVKPTRWINNPMPPSKDKKEFPMPSEALMDSVSKASVRNIDTSKLMKKKAQTGAAMTKRDSLVANIKEQSRLRQNLVDFRKKVGNKPLTPELIREKDSLKGLLSDFGTKQRVKATGLTEQQLAKNDSIYTAQERRKKDKVDESCQLRGIGKDNEGCSGSAGASARRIKREARRKNGGPIKKALVGTGIFKNNPITKKANKARGIIGKLYGLPGAPIVKNGSTIKKAQAGKRVTRFMTDEEYKKETDSLSKRFRNTDPGFSISPKGSSKNTDPGFTKTPKNDNPNIKRKRVTSEDGALQYLKNGNKVKKAKSGAMIKRADGSMSRRGLWDNIRANKGSGKKPTKQMLVQEKKIKAKSKK